MRGGESHTGATGVSVQSLLDLTYWQRLQNLFAEIVGANLWLIEPSGNPYTAPSRANSYCSDFVKPKTSTSSSEIKCALAAVENWHIHQSETFQCQHLLLYHCVPIHLQKELLGILVIGPILVGKREAVQVYESLCARLGIDADVFLDRVREIWVFSHHGIRIVLDFLKELTEHLVRLAYQRQEFERLVPGFLDAQQFRGNSFTSTYSNLCINYLLDIAANVVAADSGSVLLLNQTDKTFSIRSARGLSPEVLKRKNIPFVSTIAGWVVEKGKAVLIGNEPPPGLPKTKLKRSNIKTSILVPLEFGKKIFGVICLNAQSTNQRFNEANLALLNQLGKLAGAALAKTA